MGERWTEPGMMVHFPILKEERFRTLLTSSKSQDSVIHIRIFFCFRSLTLFVVRWTRPCPDRFFLRGASWILGVFQMKGFLYLRKRLFFGHTLLETIACSSTKKPAVLSRCDFPAWNPWMVGYVFSFFGVYLLDLHLEVDVSENSGTPKSSILIFFSIIFIIHFGGNTSIFGNTQPRYLLDLPPPPTARRPLADAKRHPHNSWNPCRRRWWTLGGGKTTEKTSDPVSLHFSL